MDTIKVYAVVNVHTREAYIGQSVDPKRRLIEHISKLKANRHHSYKFQLAYNECAVGSFKLEVLEDTESDDREWARAREWYYIHTWGKVYNTVTKSVPNKYYKQMLGWAWLHGFDPHIICSAYIKIDEDILWF